MATSRHAWPACAKHVHSTLAPHAFGTSCAAGRDGRGMPEAEPGTALTAAQFAAFQAQKAAEAAATTAAAAVAPDAPVNGRELWERCPWVFDVDEEGRPSAAALAAAAAEASLQPQR